MTKDQAKLEALEITLFKFMAVVAIKPGYLDQIQKDLISVKIGITDQNLLDELDHICMTIQKIEDTGEFSLHK